MPYSAMMKQLVKRRLQEMHNRIWKEIPAPAVTVEDLARAEARDTQREQAKVRFSIPSSGKTERKAFQQAFKSVERIRISNFKAIRSLVLDIPPMLASEDVVPWLMIVGENGCGKSSILKAIALALVGEQHANSIVPDSSSLVNYDARVAAEPAQVTIEITDLEPITLTFGGSEQKFLMSPPGEKMIVAAYGATRLLRHVTERVPESRDYVRVLNLFDPSSPLHDVEKWLLSADQDTIRHFRERLLILLPELSGLNIGPGGVSITLGRDEMPLGDLSDGYQSLIALLGDIAITMSDYWPSLKVAEGLVLLDEIDAHLHPKWKLSIVERLRLACPQMTFIATTHDPLCLKGMRDGEIVRVERQLDGGIGAEMNRLKVTNLRWEEILSSYLFDVGYTQSNGAAAMSARYTFLLGKSQRTAEEEEEFKILRQRVADMLSPALSPLQDEVKQALENVLARRGFDIESDPVRLELRRQIQETLE
jgi:hypothetical protein